MKADTLLGAVTALTIGINSGCHKPGSSRLDFSQIGAPEANPLEVANFDRSDCEATQLEEFGDKHAKIAVEIAGVLRECYQEIDEAYQGCRGLDSFVSDRGLNIILGGYEQTTISLVPNSFRSFDCCKDSLETYALANQYCYDSEMSDPDGMWTYWCTEDKGAGSNCLQLTKAGFPTDGPDYGYDPNWSACDIAISHIPSGFIQ